MSPAKMQDGIGIVLLMGTLIATLLVLIGGSLFLMQSGNQPMPFDLLHGDAYPISVENLWQIAISFSPIGLIELGLLTLIATQILRVVLVTGFFIAIKDTPFILISLFILVVLVYSCVWRY